MNYPAFNMNESMEISFVNYCIEELKLTFGEFWYKWFTTHRTKETYNYCLHLESNQKISIEQIKTTINKVENIDVLKFFSIKELDVSEFETFKFLYTVHFKNKCLI